MTTDVSLYTARTLDDTMTLGKVLAQSGYFADSREAAQAVVKILAGQELGFGPIASMTGVNIIKGKVTLSANLIASAIKRSGRYNYRVVTMTDEACRVDFYEAGERIGTSEFTMQNAKDAGLATGDNWRKFPRNMLFARAISNGAKWYCPDLSGGPIYTPDELGATVDGETGEVIDAPCVITVEKPSAGPSWPAGQIEVEPPARDPSGFDALPSASDTLPADRYEGGKAERGANGKTTPASAHDPAAPWDDNRKAEAVRWAMRRYPELFKAAPHAMNSLNNCIEAITENSTVNVAPDVIARAWKNKCENKQAELDAAKDAAAGITDAELDAQAAAEAASDRTFMRKDDAPQF